MRIDRTAAALSIMLLLAACQPDRIENVQAETENRIRELENRAEELQAKAENATNEAAEALDNQPIILANETEPAADVAGNGASGNRQ